MVITIIIRQLFIGEEICKMKTFKLIIKIAFITAAVCGLVFTVIYFREEISVFLRDLCKKLTDMLGSIKSCSCRREDSDYDDI